MVFANKIGSLLRQAVSSNPLFFQRVRCMSSSRLFVGGLSYSTDDQSLKEAFSGYGEVVEARVIVDRESGRSRGFGFIAFASGEEASAAMTALDGKEIHGRNIRVNSATDRRGGFGGGGGGFGGGGYGGGGYGGGGYGGGSSVSASTYGGAVKTFFQPQLQHSSFSQTTFRDSCSNFQAAASQQLHITAASQCSTAAPKQTLSCCSL